MVEADSWHEAFRWSQFCRSCNSDVDPLQVIRSSWTWFLVTSRHYHQWQAATSQSVKQMCCCAWCGISAFAGSGMHWRIVKQDVRPDYFAMNQHKQRFMQPKQAVAASKQEYFSCQRSSCLPSYLFQTGSKIHCRQASGGCIIQEWKDQSLSYQDWSCKASQRENWNTPQHPEAQTDYQANYVTPGITGQQDLDRYLDASLHHLILPVLYVVHSQ